MCGRQDMYKDTSCGRMSNQVWKQTTVPVTCFTFLLYFLSSWECSSLARCLALLRLAGCLALLRGKEEKTEGLDLQGGFYLVREVKCVHERVRARTHTHVYMHTYVHKGGRGSFALGFRLDLRHVKALS